MQVGDMGYAAYFKDTEGNIIGLWQKNLIRVLCRKSKIPD